MVRRQRKRFPRFMRDVMVHTPWNPVISKGLIAAGSWWDKSPAAGNDHQNASMLKP
jgi:hypothetical protein